MHEIFKDFDANPSLETCGIFLDISKAFDRVWYEAQFLNFGLIASQIPCYVYSIIFFLNGFKELFLNGQASEWWKVLAVHLKVQF